MKNMNRKALKKAQRKSKEAQYKKAIWESGGLILDGLDLGRFRTGTEMMEYGIRLRNKVVSGGPTAVRDYKDKILDYLLMTAGFLCEGLKSGSRILTPDPYEDLRALLEKYLDDK